MNKIKKYAAGILVLLLSVTTLGMDAKGQEGLKQIQSYEELISILKEKNHFYTPGDKENERWFITQNTQDIAAGGMADSIGGSYSETNVQVAGVDEADSLKVDGRYIYTCVNGNSVAIIDTKDGMKQVASINYSDPQIIYNYTVDKIFVDSKYLTVILNHSEGGWGSSRWDSTFKQYATVKVYDITDKSKPTLKRSVKVEGNLSEIRKIENQIYLVTEANIGYFKEDSYTKEQVLPGYQDSIVASEMQTIAAENIRYYDWSRCGNYTLITSFNIDNTAKAQFNVLMGDNNELYMNKDGIYITEYYHNRSSDDKDMTYITKYDIAADGTVKYADSGKVKGTLLNQFSMDEYNGYFRIATTSWGNNSGQSSNNVYVLDKGLNIVGKLMGLAQGESIYSVRFEKERGYVVTFQQIDPLFVIDLSQPEEPKVLGELKVSGFSQYLHPIGDGLVVGIGRSTVENVIRDENGKETVTGVSTGGLKLSLFDAKNPMAPVELNHIILGTKGSFSEALDTHTAVMVDAKRHLLAIPVYLQFNDKVKIADNVYASSFQGAYVFGIENGKLVGKAKLGQIDMTTGKYLKGLNEIDTGRVCYINDTMYYIYKGQINAYDMDTFKCKKVIKIK